MKKTFLFLFIIFSLVLQAQQVKINFSSAGDIKNDVTSFHKYGNRIYSDKTILGKTQFAYSANLKKIKNGVELTQYDEQLKELKTLSLDNGKDELGPFEPTIHYGADAIYVLYFKFMDDDKIKMYVSKINPGDLSITATKEITEYDQKNQAVWGTIKTIGDTHTFYTVSENGKNTWIVHTTPTQIFSSVIDNDLNIIQKTEAMPAKLNELSITGTYIDNDGNKVLAYHYKDPELKDFSRKGLLFQAANEKGSFQPVNFPSASFPGDIDFHKSRDGKKLYIAGDYFSDDYFQGSKGVFLAEVNIKDKSVSNPVLYPYTEELKQRIFDLDFASKKKGEIVIGDDHLNYRITEMENGTIILSTSLETSSTTQSNATFYFRGPVIHIFIKPGGNASMTLIPKKQVRSSSTNFFNYVYKDKLVCIYSDLPKLQEKEIDDKKVPLVRGVGDLVPVANIYDGDGKLLSKKMLLENTKGVKGMIMIGIRSEYEPGKFLMPVGDVKANMVKYFTSINQLCYVEVF